MMTKAFHCLVSLMKEKKGIWLGLAEGHLGVKIDLCTNINNTLERLREGLKENIIRFKLMTEKHFDHFDFFEFFIIQTQKQHKQSRKRMNETSDILGNIDILAESYVTGLRDR